MGFDGKVVLITGAGSGIAADAACHLAKQGALISIVDLNEKGLQETADKIQQSNKPAPLSIVADVTQNAERIVNETIEYYGKLDILINCAGIGNFDNASSIDMSVFDKVIDINLRSIVNLTRLCVPHLEQTNGNIVNVSSTGGLKPMPSTMSYCVSKAALNQFTRCCALDLAPKRIRVNAINPAAIRTPIFQKSGITEKESQEMDKLAKRFFLVGRMGEVSDTTAAIAYLANDETASFLTGILLPVDGGLLTSGKNFATPRA